MDVVQQVVGLGELKVSDHVDDVLITFSLGSCVGLSLYDPEARVGGLMHCMLPLSRSDPERAKSAPCLFTDTGVAALIQAMFDRGGVRHRLIAKVAGAARMQEDADGFNVGERNHVVLRKVLWKNSIFIAKEDVGGAVARTMSLDIATGQTFVKAKSVVTEL